MARLGHGMCHIEFLELLFKSILTEYSKNELINDVHAKYLNNLYKNGDY